eukprot:368938-Hanusia_phi.AAC.2
MRRLENHFEAFRLIEGAQYAMEVMQVRTRTTKSKAEGGKEQERGVGGKAEEDGSEWGKRADGGAGGRGGCV